MNVKRLFAIVALLPLAACFVSETPLIPEGAGVLPVDGGFVMCVDETSPCPRFEAVGDGYTAPAPGPNGDLLALRFAPLKAVEGRQIFIVEARDEADEAYLYGLARRLPAPGADGETLVAAALDCGELPEDVKADFLAAGGREESGFVTSYIPPDLAVLNEALLATFADELADEAWWAARGPR